MPLVTCPDCEREVSDKAAACPYCGRPIAETPDAKPPAEPEQTLLTVYPPMFAAHPVYFFLCVLLCFVGVGFVIFGIWALKRRSASLTVTTRRTILRNGLLSKHVTEVPHVYALNIQLSQSFWERINHVGTIGFDSAAQPGVEIAFYAPDPEKIKELIDRYRFA